MTSNKQPLIRPTTSYGRFIPREEMPDFAAWTPGAFGQAPDARAHAQAARAAQQPAAPVAPPPPTEDEWRARVQAAREQGYQDGYRDGQVALEAITQQLNAQLGARFGKMVAELDAQWDALEAGMGEAVARTAVQLARQVVRAELATRPEIVAQVAQEAVNAVLMSAKHLRLRIHPGDQGHVASGAAEVLQARDVRLVADPHVEPGGVVLESDLGRVDARIAARWAQAAAVYGRDDPWETEEEIAARERAERAAASGRLPVIDPSAVPPAVEGGAVL